MFSYNWLKQYIAGTGLSEIFRNGPVTEYNLTWGVSAKQVTPFIFDPTLKNGESAKAALV